MLRIGIVGAENTHCAAIAKLCNVENQVAARVVAVWGERPKFARAAAEAGQIPEIVRDWRGMLGRVDGVMIDHRHARDHAEPARFFIGHGVPCFVDKPFTFTLASGKALCRLAREKGVPITSFSTLPLQEDFAAFQKAVREKGDLLALSTIGPCDVRSRYGGIFFYGVHQVDCILSLLGDARPRRVRAERHGGDAVAWLDFPGGPMVTMHSVRQGLKAFHWSAVCTGGAIAWTHRNDPSPYLAGARLFVEMFRSRREPFPHERILAPVAVLGAMAKSLRSGDSARVADAAP